MGQWEDGTILYKKFDGEASDRPEDQTNTPTQSGDKDKKQKKVRLQEIQGMMLTIVA
jgi:hypothetical protein